MTLTEMHATGLRTGTLSSTEVIKEARITHRQLDSWARSGVLRPIVPARGSGTYRRWEPAEVEVAKALGKLSRGLRDASGHTGAGQGALMPHIAAAVRESLATGKPAEAWPGVLIDARRLNL